MPTHLLDDPDYVLRNDPKGMYALTCEFPLQCERAFEISQGFRSASINSSPANVVLTGLGGSAAGGDFVKAIVEIEGSVPFLVNREYSLPSFVGSNTLVIACSYSGNTEETLSAYADARSKGASTAVVTSGGKLAEFAVRDQSPAILIPGGQPPRTALGLLFVPVLFMCQEMGLVGAQGFELAIRLLGECAEQWKIEVPFDRNPAKQLAQALHGSVGIVYGLGSWQGAAAYRWKGQIGENAKNLCFWHAFPELNHNEILGWVGAGGQGVGQWVVITLEDGNESDKMKARARVTEGLIKDRASVHRARAKGESLLERILSLTLLGDFVSLYLASLNGVDPENIDWINVLKSELSKVPG